MMITADSAACLIIDSISLQGNYTLDPMDARIWDKLPLPGAPVNKYKLEFQFETPDGISRGCYSSVFKVSKK